MILILHTYLNVSCGITRMISNIINNSGLSSHIFIWSLGGDHIDFQNKYKSKVEISSNYFTASVKLFFFLFNHKNERIILHSFHRAFDLISFFMQLIFRKTHTVTSVQSKVIGKKKISYKANQIIPCSISLQKHLINNFDVDQSRINLIYNCIDANQFIDRKINLARKTKLDKNPEFRIGFAGRFSIDEKGIDVLLKAFKNVYDSRHNTSLCFVGNGHDLQFINNFKNEYSLPIDIISKQTNIQSIYESFDILVLPSRIEPFGIVIIEAGYLKIPVIASKVDGIPEIITDSVDGLLFESENDEELFNKIITLFNNPYLRKKLAENLHKKVVEKFTAGIIIPQYDNLYYKILN